MLFYIHVVQFGNDPTRLELLESQIYVINRQCRYMCFISEDGFFMISSAYIFMKTVNTQFPCYLITAYYDVRAAVESIR